MILNNPAMSKKLSLGSLVRIRCHGAAAAHGELTGAEHVVIRLCIIDGWLVVSRWGWLINYNKIFFYQQWIFGEPVGLGSTFGQVGFIGVRHWFHANGDANLEHAIWSMIDAFLMWNPSGLRALWITRRKAWANQRPGCHFWSPGLLKFHKGGQIETTLAFDAGFLNFFGNIPRYHHFRLLKASMKFALGYHGCRSSGLIVLQQQRGKTILYTVYIYIHTGWGPLSYKFVYIDHHNPR